MPTAVGLRKVVMSDKWQQINLRLDAPLAQALRELKQGHDESLSEVVIRLLRKLVRVVPAGSRGAGFGRTNAKGGAGRGAAGANRRSKPAAAGRGAARVAAPGKPWAARPPAAWGAEGEAEAPARGPRGPRRSAGKPPAPWAQGDGADQPRRRAFRAGGDKPRTQGPRAARSNDTRGAGAGGPQRPRSAKRRRTTR